MLERGEISVDFFAGGGGASQGIERAIGRPVDVAINHDPDAIRMHEANHPHTQHIQESVWKADCASFLRGKKVGLAWFSPDCKHFSRAKGTKPVNKNIRSLAWVVTWFVKKCKQLSRNNRRGPRIIILENVREFEDWGPLVPCWTCRACQWKGTEGQARLARTKRACPRCDSRRIMQTEQELPDPDRKGLTFRKFVGTLRGLGYAVEWKVLNAADYGAPTHRRRLFLVARNDGAPIVWPDPTHGDPKKIGLDFGQGVGVLVDAPCPTVTTKDRFGLVFVYVEGEPYVIVDIGMRMLRPKELARAQGFAPSTVMTGAATSQVARIGNSVPPDLAFAVADANVNLETAACAA